MAAETRPRVLMTLADVAWPVDAGKRLRSESMVRAVAAGCEVDAVVLFADADPAVRPLPPDIAGDWRVIEPRIRPARQAGTAVARHLLPWQIAVQDWRGVEELVRGKLAGCDLVWFGALDHFCQLGHLVPAGMGMVVDCDDVETDKLRRFLSLPRSAALPWVDRVQRRIEIPLWGRIQRQTVRRADAVLVCSELDRQRLAEQAAGGRPELAGRIHSVPNTYPEPVHRPAGAPDGPCTLVVVANYGTDQNVDAAGFAAREVLPALRAEIPGARLRLVGRRADRLAELAGIEGLDIVGAVDSVADELSRAHAVLVPIRFGGGTRLKVVEAMAYGVPVLSTRAGAEGIDARDGVELLLADDPAGLAAAAQRLIGDPQLRDRLVTAGRQLYERSYRPDATVSAVQELLAPLLH